MEATFTQDSAPARSMSTSSAPGAASAPATAAVSKGQRRTGLALSGLAVAFLLFDAVMKLIPAQPVIDAMQKLGFPDATARPIGLTLLACVVLYVIPRTAPLGAVLLTGYLGGAVVTHVHASDPLFSHVLFPVYFGVIVWGGLYLRDQRVRGLVRASSGSAQQRNPIE